jgi:hypothetical protein
MPSTGPNWDRKRTAGFGHRKVNIGVRVVLEVRFGGVSRSTSTKGASDQTKFYHTNLTDIYLAKPMKGTAEAHVLARLQTKELSALLH